MNWEITRQYYFSSAHRLETHPKCGRLHGHNYEVTVGVSDTVILDQQWLMDYAQLDAIVKPIIEELDHRYIVSNENFDAECPYATIAMEIGDAVNLPIKASSVECMSQWLAHEVLGALKLIDRPTLRVTVGMKESPKSNATYTE